MLFAEIFRKEKLVVSRYWSEEKRAVCYAIEQGSSRVDVTEDDLRDIIQSLPFMIMVIPKSRRRS